MLPAGDDTARGVTALADRAVVFEAEAGGLQDFGGGGFDLAPREGRGGVAGAGEGPGLCRQGCRRASRQWVA